MTNRRNSTGFTFSSNAGDMTLLSGDCRRSPCCTSAAGPVGLYLKTSGHRFVRRNGGRVESQQSKTTPLPSELPVQVSVRQCPQLGLSLPQSISIWSRRVGDGFEPQQERHSSRKSRAPCRPSGIRQEFSTQRGVPAQP